MLVIFLKSKICRKMWRGFFRRTVKKNSNQILTPEYRQNYRIILESSTSSISAVASPVCLKSTRFSASSKIRRGYELTLYNLENLERRSGSLTTVRSVGIFMRSANSKQAAVLSSPLLPQTENTCNPRDFQRSKIFVRMGISFLQCPQSCSPKTNAPFFQAATAEGKFMTQKVIIGK